MATSRARFRDFVPAMEVGSTLAYPRMSPGPALNWSFQNVPGAWWAEMMRPCEDDPVFAYNAAVMARFATTANNKLQVGIWADTHNGGFSVYGTLMNHVRGDAPFRPMVYGAYASESDAGPVPYGPMAAIQAYPEAQGTVTATTGSTAILGAATKFVTKTDNRPRVLVGDLYTFGDHAQASNFYQVSEIIDDTHLTLATPFLESTASGLPMRGPWNRPPTGADEMSSTDHHLLCLVRDEATGKPAWLYEDYNVYSPDGGGTWYSTGGVKFNLKTGSQRRDGWTTGTAGGTPLYNFVVRYDEILRGYIDHPLRGIMGNGMNLSYKSHWPAKHGVLGAGTDWTAGCLPQGARIRLNAAWWAANRASFSATNQIIGDAMKKYGLHINDLSPPNYSLGIDGFLDPRWNMSELNQLKNIPVSSFEVCDFGPETTLTLPGTTPLGAARTFTLSYNNTLNEDYNVIPYFKFTSPTNVVSNIEAARILPGNRTVSVSFTPTTPGVWTLSNTLYNAYWLTENPKTFVVS